MSPDAPKSADDATLRRILHACRTIAVVGLSADRSRPSHRSASYLQGQGCRIVPVNPKADVILDELGVEDLALLYDDMPGDAPALAAARLRVVDLAAAHTRAGRGWFCPTGELGRGQKRLTANPLPAQGKRSTAGSWLSRRRPGSGRRHPGPATVQPGCGLRGARWPCARARPQSPGAA